jgi:hypothetical protein
MKAIVTGFARCGDASRTTSFESTTVGNGACAWLCAATTKRVVAAVRHTTAQT